MENINIDAKVVIDGVEIQTSIKNAVDKEIKNSLSIENIGDYVLDTIDWKSVDDIDQELDWDNRVTEVISDNISSISSEIVDNIDWHYEVTRAVDFQDIIQEYAPEFSLDEELENRMSQYDPYNSCSLGMNVNITVEKAVGFLLETSEDFVEKIREALAKTTNSESVPNLAVIEQNIEVTKPKIEMTSEDIIRVISTSVSALLNTKYDQHNTHEAVDRVISYLPDNVRNFIENNKTI